MASATIEEALRYKLLNEATVTAEVSTRIFWMEATQKISLPYVTFFTVSNPYGAIAFGRTDSGTARIQVNVYSPNEREALRIGDIVRDSLDQFSGTVDGVVIESINCTGTHCLKDEDTFQATFDAVVLYDDI